MESYSRRTWLGMAPAAPSPRALLQERNFPNVVLTTHEGRQVRFYDDLVRDKLVMINVVYTSCKATCPLTTANLVRVQKLFGDRVGSDIFMYSLTIDPKRDTVKVLERYAASFGVGPGWEFLTGKPDDVERLRRSLGFAWRDAAFDRNKDNHTGNLKYGNEPHMLWGAVPGTANPEWIRQCVLFTDRSPRPPERMEPHHV